MTAISNEPRQEALALMRIDEERDVQTFLERFYRARGIEIVPDGDYLVTLESGLDYVTRVTDGKAAIFPREWDFKNAVAVRSGGERGSQERQVNESR